MAFVEPIILQAQGIRLEPLGLEHEDGLRAAAADGELWKLRITSVPEPEQTRAYIENALAMREAGNRFAFAVLDAASGTVLGTSSYHDIVPGIRRVEIGWTWYARRCQRSHVNTVAKLLLMTHAFETLGCALVGWRTDNFNFASQRAIERLGARKDGVLRHHAARRDGTVRDTVMYSMTAGEWPEAKAQLQYLLSRHAATPVPFTPPTPVTPVLATPPATSRTPRVLMLSLSDWTHAARLPKYFKLAGFEVAVFAPQGELIHLSQYCDQRTAFTSDEPEDDPQILRLFRRTCLDWRPDLIVPADDVSIRFLNVQYRAVQHAEEADDAAFRDLLVALRGDPKYYVTLRNKHATVELARSLNIRVPTQRNCRSREEMLEALKDFDFPVVFKGEFGVGGSGVAICRGPGEVDACWERASRKGGVCLQQYVDGQICFSTATAQRGRLVAVNAFEVLEILYPPTGTSSVIRLIDNPEITEFNRRLIEATGFNGILSVDFIISRQGEVHLIESNPRPVVATHLGRALNSDLLQALHDALTGRNYRAQPAFGRVVATFPKEFQRDPTSPYLHTAFHDVPWDEPDILKKTWQQVVG